MRRAPPPTFRQIQRVQCGLMKMIKMTKIEKDSKNKRHTRQVKRTCQHNMSGRCLEGTPLLVQKAVSGFGVESTRQCIIEPIRVVGPVCNVSSTRPESASLGTESHRRTIRWRTKPPPLCYCSCKSVPGLWHVARTPGVGRTVVAPGRVGC